MVDGGGHLLAALRVVGNRARMMSVGGVPVFSADGKTLIGAAGASGEAPADDSACVEAGIRAAG